ncbi:MAG: serine/threonine-protein kinase, partial [Kofleriaceae bacterium]
MTLRRRPRRDDPMIEVGLQIGPYRLERMLGQGGMGSVWLARHAKLGHTRAFKFLNPALTGDPALVKRFENEAMATARLKHPGLVAVHHLEQLPSGEWFMELDYLEGKSLDGWLKARTGPIPLRTIVEFISQVCDCLAHVHRLGAVHRDLKPENLFVVLDERGREQIKVLDLGIAQLNDDIVVGGATQGGAVIGTMVYMAPEQLRGKKVTPHADIYALGVIVYRMVSGGWYPYQYQHETHELYTSLHLTDMAIRHHTTMPLDLRMRAPQFPPAFAAVIMRAIDPAPDRRQQIVTELARELQDALAAVEGASGSRAASRADRYQVVKQLGEGGMAVVFLAKMRGEHGFERMVALKRVLPELAKKPEFAKMFIAEAQVASRLNHSNVVSVLDFSSDSEGDLFLVMEYIHGADLATLSESGPIPIPLAIYIAAEMLRALAYVHQVSDPDPSSRGRGLVHRDISPHNVMLGYDGTLKLMDFGLARAMTASGRAITETVRGKVAYMAPEQSRGERPDGRVDLWAVGVILWEMLAGEPLFVGTTSECLGQLQFKDIPPPSYNGRQVPADVSAVVSKLLVRAPEARYQTAEEALRELLACGAVLPDARGELAELLAERVPDPEIRAAARTKKMASVLPVRAVTSTQPQPQTTLGGAASEQMSVAAPMARSGAAGKRNKPLYLAGGAVTVVG